MNSADENLPPDDPLRQTGPQEWTIVGSSWSRLAEDLFKVVTKPWWSDRDYLERDPGPFLNDPKRIATASLAQIRAMLTSCWRADRFSKGAWADAVYSGMILHILRRLEELRPAIMIERAIEIALQVHSGATDKAGVAYILHPLHLMLQMNTPEQQIVAVLHDTVEDSEGAVTLQTLRAEGFPEQIVTAVDALTKREGETYDSFISRLAPNPLARTVKLADLRHNADLTRIQSPSPEDYDRAQKYHRSIAYLESL